MESGRGEIGRVARLARETLSVRAASFEIPSGLIRLSVGAEATADIERDLRRGLGAVAAQPIPSGRPDPAEVLP